MARIWRGCEPTSMRHSGHRTTLPHLATRDARAYTPLGPHQTHDTIRCAARDHEQAHGGEERAALAVVGPIASRISNWVLADQCVDTVVSRRKRRATRKYRYRRTSRTTVSPSSPSTTLGAQMPMIASCPPAERLATHTS